MIVGDDGLCVQRLVLLAVVLAGVYGILAFEPFQDALALIAAEVWILVACEVVPSLYKLQVIKIR